MMLMAAMMGASPVKDWDIVWTYRNGLFADSGFDVQTRLQASETWSDDAVQLKSATEGYIRIAVSGYPTCRKGVAEAEFSITEMNTTANGFRFLLSNGAYGCQTMVHRSGSNVALMCNAGADASKNINIGRINIGETYRLGIEFAETSGVRISMNDQLIYETDVFSRYYCTGNRFFAQDACAFNMYAVRYKFLEV